ncbi:MAG TPA: hypothetical protein GXZ47_01985 [Treponema sp.]|nr:hypothetical protein [Treponema sp.]
MKKLAVLISFFLLFSGSLLFAGELEVGASVGASLWDDSVGFSLAPEARWLFSNPDQPFVFGAGLAVRYNYTSLDGYTQNEVYALALASVDYLLLPKLSVRAQAGVGGGWLGASGGEGASLGALYIHPAVGVQYDLGFLKLHILGGTGFTVVSDASKHTLTLDLGATYRFKTPPKKEGL